MQKTEKSYPPYPIEVIKEGTFRSCPELLSIALPDSIKAIKRNAFNGRDVLKSIEIPKSAVHIDKEAFDECIDLQFVSDPVEP